MNAIATEICRIRTTIAKRVFPKKLFLCAWGDEYGRRGNVYRSVNGPVFLEIYSDPVHHEYPTWGFANMESFDAYRREVEYCDREHRLPGVNPHRREWNLG